jgi:curved DNA-binding protein CbpA
MQNRRNYYRILQVQPDAPIEVIKASYRALMRELKLHPDLGGDHWNAKVLNEAYAALCNPKRRAVYDKKLYERYTKNPNSDSPDPKQPLVTDFCPFCQRPLARQALNDGCCPNCKSPLKTDGSSEDEDECRRSVARIKKSGKIRYFTRWPQKGEEAKLVDMSPNGMRFVSSEKLKLGMVLKITCPTLQASAKIQNITPVQENGKEFYEVGVSFVAVSYSTPSGSFCSVTG